MAPNGYKRVQWRRWLYHPVLIMICVLLVIRTRDYFFTTGRRWVYVLLLSAAMSFCLTPLFSRIAQRFGVMDYPDQRKVHTEPTPLLGGAAVMIAFYISIAVNGIYSPGLSCILISSLVLFSVGVVDDFRHVPAAAKLVVQLICTVIVISGGTILSVVPIRFGLLALSGNAVLTVLWIVGVTNALNFFDGMDGLAAGLGAIIAFFLGIVAFQTFQPFLGWVSVALMGACVGFLPYNFRMKGNASIFLGDAGSTGLGFILACIAVYGEWAVDNAVAALISPLLIFWILIFDMIHITIDRVITGKVRNFHQWIDYVGKDHLHHRLAQVLGGNRRSVLMIYLIAVCLGTGAVVLRNARTIDAILLIFQAIIVVLIITVLERRGRALKDAIHTRNTPGEHPQ